MTAAKPQRCAVCGRPVFPELHPFCSKRCADVDLGRWLGERYVVSEPASADDDTSQSIDKDDED